MINIIRTERGIEPGVSNGSSATSSSGIQFSSIPRRASGGAPRDPPTVPDKESEVGEKVLEGPRKTQPNLNNITTATAHHKSSENPQEGDETTTEQTHNVLRVHL